MELVLVQALVEYFKHVVERNGRRGVVLRRIPEKWMF
jgi:hypothetical protein